MRRIKGIQVGDHEIKVANFADNTTIFLRDITWLIRIQVILKLYEDASSSKINFSKVKPFGSGAYKNRMDQPGQMEWSQFFIKTLADHFGNIILNNYSYLEQSETLFER